MIKVNKEVATVLDNVCCEYSHGNIAYKVFKTLETIHEECTIQSWLDKNTITIADLEKAFKEGYEEIYEFNAGDILMERNGNVFIVAEKGDLGLKAINQYIREGWTYKLVCKAEDRLDLKEDNK